jgi:hypothetical protein
MSDVAAKTRSAVRSAWGFIVSAAVIMMTLAAPRLLACDFEFVVIGDTRPCFESNAVKNVAIRHLKVCLCDLCHGFSSLGSSFQ